MGQVLLQDKIGALSEAGGTITLQPSRLTIGGQQYTTSALNVAADVSSANTRYQIFATVTAGVVSLVVSQNENSVGPAGFNAWKLVGSYMTNGLSPISFGSFINITDTPSTVDAIRYEPITQAFGTISGDHFQYSLHGNKFKIEATFTTGSPDGSTAEVHLPSPFLVNQETTRIYGNGYNGAGTATWLVKVDNIEKNRFKFHRDDTGGSHDDFLSGNNMATGSNKCSFWAELSLTNGLGNAPIEDR